MVGEGLYGSRGYLSLRNLQVTSWLSHRFRFWSCLADPVLVKLRRLVLTNIAGQMGLLPMPSSSRWQSFDANLQCGNLARRDFGESSSAHRNPRNEACFIKVARDPWCYVSYHWYSYSFSVGRSWIFRPRDVISKARLSDILWFVIALRPGSESDP